MTQKQNGVYKSKLATYFIKDDKILMLLKGNFYKTTSGYMQGVYKKPLTEKQLSQFEEAYNKSKCW